MLIRASVVRFLVHIVRYRFLSCESEQMMNTPTPTPGMTMPISLELHQQLQLAAIQSDFKKEAWEIGATAIRDWLARHAPDTFAIPTTSGFQWKHVFLPHGTLLRTVFNGKNFHALIEGDQIRYEGAVTTPSRFANAVGGVRRNAWKVIWILLPDTNTWKLADELRLRRKAGARKNQEGRTSFLTGKSRSRR